MQKGKGIAVVSGAKRGRQVDAVHRRERVWQVYAVRRGEGKCAEGESRRMWCAEGRGYSRHMRGGQVYAVRRGERV